MAECICRTLTDRNGRPYIANQEHCPVHRQRQGSGGLTYLSTAALAQKLQDMAGPGNPPAYAFGTLNKMASGEHPAVIRQKLRPDAERAKITWVWEWFEAWLQAGNPGVEAAIARDSQKTRKHRKTSPKRGRPSLSIAGGVR